MSTCVLAFALLANLGAATELIDIDSKSNQLVKIEIESRMADIETARTGESIQNQKRLFIDTLKLLEELNKANRHLKSNLSLLNKTNKISQATNPMGDVGDNLKSKFDRSIESLVEKSRTLR